MSSSPLDELFGEVEDCASKQKCTKKSLKPEDKSFRFFLAFFLSVIVICLTLITSVIYYEFFFASNPEVLGEKTQEPKLQEFNYGFESETQLEQFIHNFTNNIYKVEGSGAFGYIYGDSEDGTISLEGEAYFENGRIVLFDTNEDYKVFWSDYNKKFILLENSKKYFFVTNSADFYYRNYLGQHILQDFVDDYLRNKDFIEQINENVWEWEWFFYTPNNEFSRYSIKTEIVFNERENYISEIKLFNDQGEEICSFEFAFIPIDSIEKDSILDDYKRIEGTKVNSPL